MYSSMAQTIFSSSPSFIRLSPMVPKTFSSSPRFIRLIPTFKSPNFRRMTTVSCLKNPSPCLMLPPTFNDGSDEMVYNMYNLAQNKLLKFNNKKLIPEENTRFVGSSHGWLALLDERNRGLILTNPITRCHVELPPYLSNPFSGFRVIISCGAEQEECKAMMIYNGHSLEFCRPGRSPTEWTQLGVHLCPLKNYEDLVYSSRHNLLFCIANAVYTYDFEAWDVAYDPPRLHWEHRADWQACGVYSKRLCREKNLLPAKTCLWCNTFKYLVFVEQTDQLFFVTRHIVSQMALDGSPMKDLAKDSYPYKTISFDVHKVDWKLDGEGGRLSHVDGGSLDGLAMFVGVNHSFAVLATEDNGLKPNSIYFTNDKGLIPDKDLYPKEWLNWKQGDHDIGIFDYENKTISCYDPCDLQNFKRVTEPIWANERENELNYCDVWGGHLIPCPQLKAS
ncbi:hypothetical protein CASFOL_008747 [Castilleja foliolosa]|uniref:KIB1-4 beta-propeller domain-containing protein n=1 Tax=Castilleja foliolosa TaxID=1961234 RepID=A0ABD3E3X5_9LAMI